MKPYVITVFIFAVLLFPFFAESYAGQIYGTIKNSGGAVGIVIQCPNQAFGGTTNKDGSYSIYVPTQGKCVFLVNTPWGPALTEIFIYNQPVKYDFVVVPQPNKLPYIYRK